jgi:hypothetical protein
VHSGANFSTSGFDNFYNIAFKLWNRIGKLPCDLLLQETIRFFATFQHLVRALHKLNELSSVDVRVSRALDIVCDLWRDVDENIGSCV